MTEFPYSLMKADTLARMAADLDAEMDNRWTMGRQMALDDVRDALIGLVGGSEASRMIEEAAAR